MAIRLFEDYFVLPYPPGQAPGNLRLELRTNSSLRNSQASGSDNGHIQGLSTDFKATSHQAQTPQVSTINKLVGDEVCCTPVVVVDSVEETELQDLMTGEAFSGTLQLIVWEGRVD
ncbi:MAG: hypothetical protein MMC33_003854 [Icmadophila ericetorum]|nr:hypothetical protein [Icmadophila ericetorum]